MRRSVETKILSLILVCNLLFIVNPLELDFSYSSMQNASYNLVNEQTITLTEYNSYYPDGNISILVAVDTSLLGEGKFFNDYSSVKTIFEYWLVPFEKRFDLKFHVYNVTTFTPGENDSLDVSIDKVAGEIHWTFADGINDTLVNGNNYDFLLIYQKDYRGGRNQANAIYGNALIIAHFQPLDWTSRQLILLHEVGHIFGGVHYEDGYIPPDWYGSNNSHTIMSYDDLEDLKEFGWNKDQLPMDDHNFEIINSSRYRFDQNDADFDGIPNYYENRYGMNPCLDETSLDLDNDGLTDLEEFLCGTDPSHVDSDKDTYSDWAENYLETSPINSSDFPILNEPVLITWSNNQITTKEQNLSLQWRGIATNKDSYSIYQNNTLLINSQWTQELITYEITGLKPGNWIIKCIVTDDNGNSANASITIIFQKEDKVIIEGVFSIIAVLAIIYIKRLKVK